jgi:hypothetical protein
MAAGLLTCSTRTISIGPTLRQRRSASPSMLQSITRTLTRVELIIVRGADEIRHIDLTDESHRERVLAVKTKEHLALLFDEFA